MLWTIAVVLIVLWALGLVSSYTMGGLKLPAASCRESSILRVEMLILFAR